jgi:hypothetical protein
MTPTTICVKTKEMCENFPGKKDLPKKCVKRTICAQILSAKTAPYKCVTVSLLLEKTNNRTPGTKDSLVIKPDPLGNIIYFAQAVSQPIWLDSDDIDSPSDRY